MRALLKKSSGICVECIKNNKSVCLSIFFLLCAFVIGMYRFQYTYMFFFKRELSLSPTLYSGIGALLIVSPVFIRGKADIINNHSLSVILLFILDICVFSTLANAIFSNKNIIPFIPVNGYTILFMGGLLSWLGIKMIAGYIWVLLIFLSLTRLTTVDSAMGFSGFLYILFSALGILFQIKDICGSDFSLKDYISSSAGAAGRVAREDVSRSVEATGAIAGAALSAYTGGQISFNRSGSKSDMDMADTPFAHENARLAEARELVKEACMLKKMTKENGIKLLNMLDLDSENRERAEMVIQRLQKLCGHI